VALTTEHTAPYVAWTTTTAYITPSSASAAKDFAPAKVRTKLLKYDEKYIKKTTLKSIVDMMLVAVACSECEECANLSFNICLIGELPFAL
jgi:hypothetical protein